MMAAAIAGMVVYGSLYPFDFYARGSLPEALRALLDTWRTGGSRTDAVANVLLYLPLAFCAAQSLAARVRLRHVLLVFAACAALSATLELTQFYDRGRDSTLSDVYCNALGALLGAAAASTVRFTTGEFLLGRWKAPPFPVFLLLSWLAYRLYPYVPAADLHKYWTAVKPLLYAADLPWRDFYGHTVIWLAVALLLEDIAGPERRRWVFFLFLPIVFFLRVVIVDIQLSRAEVAGAALALPLWLGPISQWRARAALVALLFTVVVILQSLEPFTFQPIPRPFGWVPFRSFLQGSLSVNICAFAEKCFTYGALLWLLRRAGLALPFATVCGGTLVFCLRRVQVYLPGRSAEITDLLLLLFLAGLLAAAGSARR